MFFVFAQERVLKHFAKASRDGTQLDIASSWQIAAHALQSLENKLPREVVVHSVLKHDGDHANPDL